MTTTTIEQFREQCLDIAAGDFKEGNFNPYALYDAKECAIRKAIHERIAALPLPVMPEQAEPVAWIKCSERMPEDGKNVLAVIYLTARPHAKMMRIINYPINLDFIVLTHWMPLPELPKD